MQIHYDIAVRLVPRRRFDDVEPVDLAVDGEEDVDRANVGPGVAANFLAVARPIGCNGQLGSARRGTPACAARTRSPQATPPTPVTGR